MADIQAVIFDADGTILDTREFILQAYEHTLLEHHQPVPDRVTIAKNMGQTLVDSYSAFAPSIELDLLRSAHRKFQETNLDLIAGYEDLLHILDILRDAGIKLAVCSSRGTTLHMSLEHAGISEYFSAVIDGDDVTDHKPHPEGLLKALEIMQVDPKRAAMVGDTTADIGAGKAAGVAFTIGLTHGFGARGSLLEAGADHIVDRLADIIPLVLDERP